ncbi:hypothetical protein [Limnoglobus roseus]|uniref:Uncharacterized protein n=1 Tax=Limnoglobus roseus TaxID=2598579 RepID=A0A5C1AQX5_9BACT|nr:hypothetical protein [Limnoglobus roseus]QEL20132.1 hypothetical protein PX52LOC_07220 [Limnoglobus roseus]
MLCKWVRVSLVGWSLAVFAWGMTTPAATAKEPEGFVVHEWGTFSTFSGADGTPLKFTPNDTDLPPLVFDERRPIVNSKRVDSFKPPRAAQSSIRASGVNP